MEKSDYLNFNINYSIFVKLTREGYKVWKKENERWITDMQIPQSLPSEPVSDYEKRVKQYKAHQKYCKQLGVHPMSWYKKQTNKNGYVEFQTWHFIQMFGKYTGLGRKQMYQTEILIKKSDLKPIK